MSNTPSSETKTIVLTKAHMKSASTSRGGYTKKQIESLKAIDISGPSKASGKTVTEEWYQKFLSLGKGKGAVGKRKNSNSQSKDRSSSRTSIDNLEVLVIANTLLKSRRSLMDEYALNYCTKASKFPETLTLKQKLFALTLAERYSIEELVEEQLRFHHKAGKKIFVDESGR